MEYVAAILFVILMLIISVTLEWGIRTWRSR